MSLAKAWLAVATYLAPAWTTRRQLKAEREQRNAEQIKSALSAAGTKRSRKAAKRIQDMRLG